MIFILEIAPNKLVQGTARVVALLTVLGILEKNHFS